MYISWFKEKELSYTVRATTSKRYIQSVSKFVAHMSECSCKHVVATIKLTTVLATVLKTAIKHCSD